MTRTAALETHEDTTTAEFFEAKYQAAADPWSFASSTYEQQRYAATVAALRDRRYRRAFEPGCSVGELTAGLAGLCAAVEAVDLSPTAVARAQQRCASLPNVRIRCGALPDCLTWPGMEPAGFDLLVLSEIGYYFTAAQWQGLVRTMIDPLPPGATVIGVHWLGSSPDHCIGGDAVHDILDGQTALQLQHRERHATADGGFRLDRWGRL